MLAAIGKTVRRHIQHAHDLGRIEADDPLAEPERRSRQCNAIDQRPRFGLLPIRQRKERVLNPVQRYQIMKDTLPILRSEEHTSELQSLMRISYAVFRLK